MIISSEIEAPASSVRSRAAAVALGSAALVGGAWAALHYSRAGLTLSHYDAKAHLVVARRIFDSLTPGYQQVGAVWLPLPHLLNAAFVQYDPWFRTGASAVALSVVSFALAVFAVSSLVKGTTRSTAAAFVSALAVALNPNLLYLQSTPMTEPVFLGVTFAAVWLLHEWVDGARDRAIVPGIALALACLTRYEAWPIVLTALGAAWWALIHPSRSAVAAARRLARVAVYPLATLAGFLIHSRVTVGEWFVRDFYTPDNPARHDLQITTAQVWWGVTHLSGPLVAAAMAAAAIAVLAVGLVSRHRRNWILLLAPLAAVAVPWMAFFSGHPYRIRYMIPLAAAAAIPLGAAASLAPRRLRLAVCVALAAMLLFELRPLDPAAPMVAEAQWDRPNIEARRVVKDCLAREFEPGQKVMASMGSLAHVMQETAASGFVLNDYLHEGNGDIWLQTLVSPRPYVEWILIQEYAEGGDMLARLARERPAFLDGFVRECEGGGVVLYRRAQ